MMYAAAIKGGRVVDIRDRPYSNEEVQKLSEAYGVSLVVYEDFDSSVLESCPARVKMDEATESLVVDVEAQAEVDHEKAMASVIGLYQARVAMQAAIADGFSIEDELAAVDARINEVRGEVAEIVARRVDDVSFFTRLLIYLGLR